MATNSRRVLVTGGSGFIGRNLAASLAGSWDVLAPRRAELDLVDDDSVAAWFDANEVHGVVHAATTPAHRNAAAMGDVAARNLRMFFNLMRHERRWTRMLVLGSGAEYDARHYSPKMTEERFGEHLPADPSGFSKFVISQLAAADPRVTVLRLFGVFGPHEDWEIRFISNAICKALFDRPITLRQNRRFDYLWIEDLAPVIGRFLETDPRRRAYNVTPDESQELHSLAQIVRDVSGKNVEIRVAEPGLGVEYSGSNERIHRDLPGLTFTPPRVAIERLYRWYEGHREMIRPEALDRDK